MIVKSKEHARTVKMESGKGNEGEGYKLQNGLMQRRKSDFMHKNADL
jgi:hypothetical protein